ncbi:MAG: hypothetical protein KDB22_28935, partial [Planctomycetales bacterium]|nr:hypothetical protein [Planctomycetales bacterium]
MKLAASLTLLIVFFFPNLTSRAWSQRLEAETILSWDFRRQDDTNLDQLPDGWKRRRDREHPAFVKMQITAKDPERDRASKSAQHLMSQVWHALKTGNWNPSYIPEVTPPEIAEFMDKFVLDNCLEVVMQGGNAEYVSPIFPMESRFAYRLRGLVDTTKLYGHTAWIELHLLDSDEQTLRVLPTAASTGDSAWHRVETELASEQDERLAWGRVHIKVDKSDATYFEGAARFDALAVMRQPRLRLTTPLPYQIASPGQPVVVTCRALGIRQLGSSVEFLLQDCMGETMRSEKIVLQRAAPGEMPDRSSPADAHFVAKHSNVGTEELFDGEAVWKLQFDTPGLYRVSVNLGRDAGKSTRRELLIAVMSAAEPFNAGPFGWSWPDLDSDARFQALPELVRHFGAGWIKIPIWFDSTDTNAADRLVELADRLQVEGVKCVGRIENPPKRLRDMLFDNDDQAYSVSVFRDPAAWEPVLEPVLTRMGLKIAWFQLGTDDDFSFMGVPDPANMLAD